MDTVGDPKFLEDAADRPRMQVLAGIVVQNRFSNCPVQLHCRHDARLSWRFFNFAHHFKDIDERHERCRAKRIRGRTDMSRIYLLHKPFRVLSQFTDDHGRRTLADYLKVPDVYAAGRLDHDSEGLLLLTDDGGLIHRISDPRHKLAKTYWVQVEGEPDETVLQALREGIPLKDGPTRPARVRRLAVEPVAPREPPVRYRASIPTTWLELELREGRNRQVRRMTAHVGHPTLRLVRAAIGPWRLGELGPGEWRSETLNMPQTSAPRKPKRRQTRLQRHDIRNGPSQ